MKFRELAEGREFRVKARQGIYLPGVWIKRTTAISNAQNATTSLHRATVGPEVEVVGPNHETIAA